jgi:chromosome condensin MukBEF ATPase and DNA-binding subunit MukB
MDASALDYWREFTGTTEQEVRAAKLIHSLIATIDALTHRAEEAERLYGTARERWRETDAARIVAEAEVQRLRGEVGRLQEAHDQEFGTAEEVSEYIARHQIAPPVREGEE